ncbi:hypothetical protein [Sphingomonas sp.]|uniref:hypothetical protein n=1 Tax=Sphingomonas sp. TaxID=28214 RepID=UPI0025CFA2EA|nr:hypothetical protein [Sphingomonas sp.]
MFRLFHLGLLIMTLIGLIGQSSAMAMAQAAPASRHAYAVNSWAAGMDCAQMPMAPGRNKGPCKQISLQCIAAMGCSPLALTVPDVRNAEAQSVEPSKTTPSAVARLAGRSYGPEPDPPTFLI